MPIQRVAVRCGFLVGGIILPFFFETGVSETITVNGARLSGHDNRVSCPKDLDVDSMWFHEDGASKVIKAICPI